VTFGEILNKKNAKSSPISFFKNFKERFQNLRVFLPSLRRRRRRRKTSALNHTNPFLCGAS